MNIRENGWEGVYWIHLAQNRDQWRLLYGNVPLGSIKGGEFLDYVSDYQRLKKDLLRGVGCLFMIAVISIVCETGRQFVAIKNIHDYDS
jgi:hypothetical protein